jgi:radical SAM superfamily enzyme YgiQ (UPF0313 family)
MEKLIQEKNQREISEDLEQKQRPIIVIHPGILQEQSSLLLPLGLAHISAVLKRKRYEVTVIDLLFDNDLKKIEDLNEKNGIYIISFSTSLVGRVREIIEIIRKKDENSFIMCGGAHPTARREKIFDELNIDLIALGEVKIVDVVNSLHNKDWSIKLPEINGIMYKYNGKIYINPPVDEWEDLNDLPIPDLEAFPIDKYFKHKGFREISILSSKGCPYRCTFCQPILLNLFGPKVRYATDEKTVDGIEYLVNKFKLDIVLFIDDTFAFNQQRVIDICKEIIRRKIPVLWRCQTRVGLKRDVLEYMKKAGCFIIAFGVESGSQKILDNVNKQVTVDMIIDTFKNCKDVGILTHAYLMVGNVGESKETINETIELIKKIRPFSYNISTVTPYPGTYLYEYAKENNVIMNPDWKGFNHLLKGAVAKLSDFDTEELPKIKLDIEKSLDKEIEKTKPLIRLILDKNFISRIFNILVHNPTMPFRLLKLVIRSYTKGGSGVRVSNPKVTGYN